MPLGCALGGEYDAGFDRMQQRVRRRDGGLSAASAMDSASSPPSVARPPMRAALETPACAPGFPMLAQAYRMPELVRCARHEGGRREKDATPSRDATFADAGSRGAGARRPLQMQVHGPPAAAGVGLRQEARVTSQAPDGFSLSHLLSHDAGGE